MWHTYYSSGDIQIDEDHANIDYMLEICREESTDWQRYAKMVLDAYQAHLYKEERICEEKRLNMTEEHKGEHIYLFSQLEDLQKQLNQGAIGKLSFIDVIRKMLLFHVSYFDKGLSG